MRVALVSPLMEAVPPRTYGGIERVVASLAEALNSKGHQVTVFANAESRVNAELVVCRDRSLLTDERLTEGVADHILMLDRVRRMADRFDIINFHTELLHFPTFEDIANKTVTTCHSRLDHVGLSDFFRRYRSFPLVSISNAQRRPLPHANWAATIPHGYPLDSFRHLPHGIAGAKGQHLAFLGRIAPDKGVDTAIEIARRANMRLKIAARIHPSEQPYWEQAIKPQVDGQQIEYVGEIGDHQKIGFLNDALALLFPIRWPEPFGLVMIEAMACGTPVIAYPFGSVPEVIEDGVTGRIVNSLHEAVSAVGDVDSLDRKAIRREFERRFSSEQMAEKYLTVYRRLLSHATDTRRAIQRRLVEAGGRRSGLSNLGLPVRQNRIRPTIPEDPS